MRETIIYVRKENENLRVGKNKWGKYRGERTSLMLLVEANAREKRGCWKQVEMFILYCCEGGAKNNTGPETGERNKNKKWG